jgi:hypothetical protein
MPSFDKRILVIVGGYGSGKSEVAVNLARYLISATDQPVLIADLDIINPYFRSREAAAELAALGVRSLVPPGEQAQADLPIVIPEIKGAIEQHDGYLILDVGGDDVGSRVLSSLADAFVPGTYDMLLVLNGNRPFTATVEGARNLLAQIETASRLSFTGLIGNTHMLEFTTPEIVLEGLALTEKVSAETGLPIRFISLLAPVLEKMPVFPHAHPLLPLGRSLVKPWEKKHGANGP